MSSSLAVSTEPLPRVFVLDDEPGMTQLLNRILRRHYDVTTESDPRRFVERLVNGDTFDLVLCDLMMSPLRGLDVYEAALKLAPEHAERFVFMTGGATNSHMEDFINEWPFGVLRKPFEPAEVVKLVGARLHQLSLAQGSQAITLR